MKRFSISCIRRRTFFERKTAIRNISPNPIVIPAVNVNTLLKYHDTSPNARISRNMLSATSGIVERLPDFSASACHSLRLVVGIDSASRNGAMTDNVIPDVTTSPHVSPTRLSINGSK